MKIHGILLLLPLAVLFSSCGKKPDETATVDPPVLVKVSPEDGASDVTIGNLSAVFTYDQNVKVLSSDKSKISVSGGEAVISGINAYGKEVTVSVSGLSYGTAYTVTIPAGVVRGFRDSQDGAAAARTSFTTVPEPEDPGTDEHLSDVGWDRAAELGLGWNIGNQLDAFSGTTPNETVWGNAKCTQATFNAVKAAGFTSVRIPVTWLDKIGPAPDYTIDATWMNRVYEVVGYAEAAGLHAIVNTHHDEDHGDGHWLDLKGALASAETNAQIKAEITAVWTQIAEKFRDKGEWLMFESFNELIYGNEWSIGDNAQAKADIINEWNQTFVDAVRATGGNNATRWLGAPTYAANPSFVSYYEVPDDPAGKVMVSVHYYEPSPYTSGSEQYTDWGHTGATGQKATYGDEDFVQSTFNTLMRNYVNKGIPVYMGEFGCSMRSKSNARAWAFYKYYMEYVVKAAKTYGMSAFLWDNGANGYGKEHHGYINHGTGAYISDSKEVVDVMVKAMNNNSPSYTLQSVYDNAPVF